MAQGDSLLQKARTSKQKWGWFDSPWKTKMRQQHRNTINNTSLHEPRYIPNTLLVLLILYSSILGCFCTGLSLPFSQAVSSKKAVVAENESAVAAKFDSDDTQCCCCCFSSCLNVSKCLAQLERKHTVKNNHKSVKTQILDRFDGFSYRKDKLYTNWIVWIFDKMMRARKKLAKGKQRHGLLFRLW